MGIVISGCCESKQNGNIMSRSKCGQNSLYLRIDTGDRT